MYFAWSFEYADLKWTWSEYEFDGKDFENEYKSTIGILYELKIESAAELYFTTSSLYR